jgi:hypothetical protein
MPLGKSVRNATHLVEPLPATLHRDIVIATRPALTKVRHQNLLGYLQKDNQARLFTRRRGAPSMCDYSLHHVATRPARVEDRLVTTKFYNTITRGFAAVSDPRVAVCLLPGTELAFDRDVECEAALAIFPTKKIGQRVARFRQINTEQPTMHHDALEFADGQIVLLTALCDNQHATVLQMPAAPRVKSDAGQTVTEPGATVLASEPRGSFVV